MFLLDLAKILPSILEYLITLGPIHGTFTMDNIVLYAHENKFFLKCNKQIDSDKATKK